MTIGTKVVVNASRDLFPMGPIAEGNSFPSAVLGVPPLSLDDLITGSRMKIVVSRAILLALVSSMVSFLFHTSSTIM